MEEKQSQNCIWIGIGVDIPERSEFYGKIMAMNDLLVEKYGVDKDFAGNKHPYLNLYDLSVPEENIEMAVDKIKAISADQESFLIKTREVDYFPFGLFFLEVEKNEKLENLHRKIVEEIVKFREHCIDKDYLAPHRKYNERQKELLMQYGNPHVLDQFQPHITIGHVINKREKLNTIQKELNKLITVTEFRVDNVHVVAEDEKDKKNLANLILK